MNHNRIHDGLVHSLVDRLFENSQYDYIEANLQYHTKRGCGEYDVLTKRVVNGKTWWHYYEIKSNDTEQAYKKAKSQFQRAKSNYSNRNWRFVYVTPTRVEEVRC